MSLVRGTESRPPDRPLDAGLETAQLTVLEGCSERYEFVYEARQKSAIAQGTKADIESALVHGDVPDIPWKKSAEIALSVAEIVATTAETVLGGDI